MRRPYKTSQTPFGTRLEAAIQQTYRSHRALAEQTGIAEGTISNYIRHGKMPAGPEMIKLAHAFPGQMDFILTGREPTAMEPWRALIEAVPEEYRESLEAYARMLASGDGRFLPRIVENLKHEEYMFKVLRRDYPATPT